LFNRGSALLPRYADLLVEDVDWPSLIVFIG
jgi:hypothetical protein